MDTRPSSAASTPTQLGSGTGAPIGSINAHLEPPSTPFPGFSSPSLPDAPKAAGHTVPSRPIENLVDNDVYLASAPRETWNGHRVPRLGDFLIFSKLGEGGMGAVYHGFQLKLEREIAVKILTHNDPASEARFLQEAKTAARIQSHYTVRIIYFGRENRLAYFAMEYVKGASAGDALRIAGRGLDEAIALDICIAASTGLAAAHQLGVMHRDVKPGNILIPADLSGGELQYRDAMMADFGLAREVDVHALDLTHSPLGTPGFMAPEQVTEWAACGPRADVWGLGATLYSLLAARPPFMAESAWPILTATVNTPHPPVGSLRSGISPATVALIDRCLAKKPDARYKNGSALRTALAEAREALLLARSGGGRAHPIEDVTREIVLDLGGGIPLELVAVAPGSYTMGSDDPEAEEHEKPLHRVRITKAFYIGKHPVTVGQFTRFVDAAGYHTDAEKKGRGYVRVGDEWAESPGANWRNPGFAQADDHPVVQVSWNDAQAFAAWATQIARRDITLPSEAQWEYAARGPRGLLYPWGDDFDDRKCNHQDSGIHATTPSGHYANASWCGAFDMAGNVRQWCQDTWNSDAYKELAEDDPLNMSAGEIRVVRGGSCESMAWYCRSSYRYGVPADDAYSCYGFRVAGVG